MRLVDKFHVRFPLLLRNVERLVHERGFDIYPENERVLGDGDRRAIRPP